MGCFCWRSSCNLVCQPCVSALTSAKSPFGTNFTRQVFMAVSIKPEIQRQVHTWFALGGSNLWPKRRQIKMISTGGFKFNAGERLENYCGFVSRNCEKRILRANSVLIFPVTQAPSSVLISPIHCQMKSRPNCCEQTINGFTTSSSS